MYILVSMLQTLMTLDTEPHPPYLVRTIKNFCDDDLCWSTITTMEETEGKGSLASVKETLDEGELFEMEGRFVKEGREVREEWD